MPQRDTLRVPKKLLTRMVDSVIKWLTKWLTKNPLELFESVDPQSPAIPFVSCPVCHHLLPFSFNSDHGFNNYEWKQVQMNIHLLYEGHHLLYKYCWYLLGGYIKCNTFIFWTSLSPSESAASSTLKNVYTYNWDNNNLFWLT